MKTRLMLATAVGLVLVQMPVCIGQTAGKEDGGVTAVPLKYIKLNLSAKNNGVEVSWTIAGSNEHPSFEIERSNDGVNFTKIGRVAASFFTNASYAYLDNNAFDINNLYYRVRQCNSANECLYSEVKTIKVTGQKSIRVYPQYTGNLFRITYTADNATDILMIVFNNTGSEVHREKRKVAQGANDFNITIDNLPRGYYVLKIIENGSSESCSFVR